MFLLLYVYTRVKNTPTMSRTYGYARTSTTQQVLGLEDQIQKLQEHGCKKVFSERISSRKPASERHNYRQHYRYLNQKIRSVL